MIQLIDWFMNSSPLELFVGGIFIGIALRFIYDILTDIFS
jgi:hypothetical protein